MMGNLPEDLVHTLVKGATGIGAVLFTTLMMYLGSLFSKQIMGEEAWRAYVYENYHLVAGLPLAATAAFGVVVYFDATTSEVFEISILGTTFKGPAAPAFVWMFLFLALVLGIRTLAPRR